MQTAAPANLPLPGRGMVLLLTALLCLPIARAESERHIGDFLAAAIPLATVGTELYRGDTAGTWQYVLTLAATSASTEVLKRETDVERPDGSDDLSFPSGHAARSFPAAAYVRRRHGLRASVPLYLAALYVGHTRVDADRHRWVDIAGAALISEVWAAVLVQRLPVTDISLSANLAPRHASVSIMTRW